jgi:pyruvate kinase
MPKEILCTLGPASLNERVIQRLEELGVSLFRINLSHTEIRDLPSTIRFIGERTTVPLCLDTEGAQIRTSRFVDGSVMMRENTLV